MVDLEYQHLHKAKHRDVLLAVSLVIPVPRSLSTSLARHYRRIRLSREDARDNRQLSIGASAPSLDRGLLA